MAKTIAIGQLAEMVQSGYEEVTEKLYEARSQLQIDIKSLETKVAALQKGQEENFKQINDTIDRSEYALLSKRVTRIENHLKI